MLKNITQLEATINGKVHRYLCENDSALPEVKEALFQFQKYVGQIEDQSKSQQNAAKAKEEADKAALEEPKPE